MLSFLEHIVVYQSVLVANMNSPFAHESWLQEVFLFISKILSEPPDDLHFTYLNKDIQKYK